MPGPASTNRFWAKNSRVKAPSGPGRQVLFLFIIRYPMQLKTCPGFSFIFNQQACDECGGRCCSGNRGNVWVNPPEIERLAIFLGLNSIEVIHRFLKPVDNRLSIEERYDEEQFHCIFFDIAESRCTIYEARPDQCRRFPFWDHYRDHPDELFAECPGVSPLEPGD